MTNEQPKRVKTTNTRYPPADAAVYQGVEFCIMEGGGDYCHVYYSDDCELHIPTEYPLSKARSLKRFLEKTGGTTEVIAAIDEVCKYLLATDKWDTIRDPEAKWVG